MKKNISILAFAAAIICGCTNPSAKSDRLTYAIVNPEDSEEMIVAKAANVVPSARQFKWQAQELTAFIHFGINTFYGTEWGDGTEDPVRFNPTELDAEQWISNLADNGFKCAILTCKHHDGFCLWPSKFTEHSVKNSPWKGGNGDVVREVADACRKHGIGFGVYLSPWDRNSALYGTDEYNDYFVNQLTELLTDYGDVSEVWFDGACGEGPNGKTQTYDFPRWYALIRNLQPDAVIAVMGPDVRWVGTETGRGRSTEWSVVPNDMLDQDAIAENSQQEQIAPPTGDMMGDDLGSREVISKARTLVWYPAEIDVSIRPGWFYHSDQDAVVKTAGQLMDIYFTSVGMNGVLLLNIPPDTRGLFADEDIRSLREFKDARDAMYSRSVMEGCRTERRNKPLVDRNYDTHVVMGSGSEASFDLSEEKCFNVICLQEDIRFGQRVEEFALDVMSGDGEWVEVVKGTTIGYKRLIRLEEQCSSKVRLRIIRSRLDAAVCEFDLIKYE